MYNCIDKKKTFLGDLSASRGTEVEGRCLEVCVQYAFVIQVHALQCRKSETN